MSKTNIILAGFMGTGKSTLGRLLARKLGYRFIDTDQAIEERLGKTIAELFATEGEGVFRELETTLITELATQNRLVIATGGGLVLNPRNVDILQQSGRIFCLTATPEEILERISRQQHVRPLLHDPTPLARIKTLLEQREASYRQFPQISTSGRSQDELVAELHRRTTGDG